MPHPKLPLGTSVPSHILSALRSRASRKLRGFTLVELIVVITILAILATIGFLALSGYTSDANKSAVVGNLRTVEKWLSTNATVTGKFPVPTNPVTVTYSGGTAWYQGTAGKSVMSAIGMGEPPKDPNGNSEFDYSLSANGMEYQVASAYLSAASAEGFVTETSAAATDGTNVRTPTAAVTGNYNGLFVPVSTGGTNYLVAAPGIVLSNVSLSVRELKSMAPSFVVDGKPGTPASWSGKVAGLSQTGIAFGVSVPLYSSGGSAFPKTASGISALASAVSAAYSGTSLASVSKIQTFLASPSNMDSAVSSAGANSLGRDMAPAYSASSSGGGSSGTPGNSCAAQPSFANAGTFTAGSPTSAGQAWTYSATPGNCTYTCSGGYSGTDCATPTDPNWNGVSLLLHGDGADGKNNNVFVDSSSNNLALTRNGDVTQWAFSPFVGQGGSAYFDGVGDRVFASSNAILNPSGDFTWETWAYPTSSSNSFILWLSNGDYFAETVLWYGLSSSGKFTFQNKSSAILTSANVFPLNAWYHVAVSRSGTTSRLFVNGKLEATSTTAWSPNSGYPFLLGDRPSWAVNAQYPFTGYLSNATISGIAKYVAEFSVPTSPFVSNGNTAVLLKFENAGVIDSARKSVITTIGDAKISTAQSKFGGGSVTFDGVGDSLIIGANSDFEYGTAPFTVEMYVRPSSVWAWDVYWSTESSSYCYFATDGGWYLRGYLNGATVTSSSALPSNQWSHIAMTRDGAWNLRIFLNGVLIGSATGATASIPKMNQYIGSAYDLNDWNRWSGHIDDLRITKGVARYASDFSASLPSSPFPNQ